MLRADAVISQPLLANFFQQATRAREHIPEQGAKKNPRNEPRVLIKSAPAHSHMVPSLLSVSYAGV